MLQSITHFLLFEHTQYFIVLPLQLPPQTLTLDCSPWYVLTVLSILPKIIGCLIGVPASLRVHSEGRNEKVQHCDTRCTLSHLRPLLTIRTMRPSCSVGGASLIVVCAGSPAVARAPRPIAARECS